MRSGALPAGVRDERGSAQVGRPRDGHGTASNSARSHTELSPGGLMAGVGDERGSGTVLMAGVIAALLVLALGVSALVQAQAAAGRARAAADLAALGGATALSSVTAPGDPCAVAERVAAADGAVVRGCSVVGEDVTVRVEIGIRVLGAARTAAAVARAGPVDSG